MENGLLRLLPVPGVSVVITHGLETIDRAPEKTVRLKSLNTSSSSSKSQGGLSLSQTHSAAGVGGWSLPAQEAACTDQLKGDISSHQEADVPRGWGPREGGKTEEGGPRD